MVFHGKQKVKLQGGIVGRAGYYPTHRIRLLPGSLQGFPNGLPLPAGAKVFLCQPFREDNGVGLAEQRLFTAFQQRKVENVQKIRPYIKPFFVKRRLFPEQGQLLREGNGQGSFRFRYCFVDLLRKGHRSRCPGTHLPLLCRKVESHLIDAVGIGMKAVVAQLVPHPEKEQQADGDARAQAQYVDGSITEISLKIANSDDQEMF